MYFKFRILQNLYSFYVMFSKKRKKKTNNKMKEKTHFLFKTEMIAFRKILIGNRTQNKIKYHL